MKHLLLLEVKPPSRLGVAQRAPMRVVSRGKVCEGRSRLRKGRDKASGSRKAVERDPARWTFLNGDVGFTVVNPNFGKQIFVSPLWFVYI